MRINPERVWGELEKLPSGYYLHYARWYRNKNQYDPYEVIEISRQNFERVWERLAELVKSKESGIVILFEIAKWFKWEKLELKRNPLVENVYNDLHPFVEFLQKVLP